ncbi:MAG: TlpA family protein disulfide reductase [Chloroflexi bacterium]|nr:TlpA family protein disulfide reductase [Chloroflexota bacterium]
MLIWGALFALLALVAVGLYITSAGPVTAGASPDFSLTTFDGQTHNLKDLRGQVVLVNFWASWCKPCEQEAAALESAWRFYKDKGVVFLGVDYVDTETEARAYLRKWDITYPNGPDKGTRISQAFRIRGVPETYIIDQKGQLANNKIGPFISEAEIHAMLDLLLAGN